MTDKHNYRWPAHRLFRVVVGFDTYVCAANAADAERVALANVEDDRAPRKATARPVVRVSEIPDDDMDVLPWGGKPHCLLCDSDCSVGDWHQENAWERFRRPLSGPAKDVVFDLWDWPALDEASMLALLGSDSEEVRRQAFLTLGEPSDYDSYHENASDEACGTFEEMQRDTRLVHFVSQVLGEIRRRAKTFKRSVR